MTAPETGVEVLHHQSAHVDEQIGVFHHTLQSSRSGAHAVVHPKEGGMPFTEQGLVHRRGGIGQP